MNGRIVNYIIASVVGTIIIASFLLEPARSNSDRNAVDQRNHKRDRIECESAGGFLGESGYNRSESIYSICHDVDSLIVLNGAREKYSE